MHSGCGPVCDPYKLLIATTSICQIVNCSLDENEKVNTSIEIDRGEEMPEVRVLWKNIRPSSIPFNASMSRRREKKKSKSPMCSIVCYLLAACVRRDFYYKLLSDTEWV